MRKRLVKTLLFEHGELYGIIDGRRILLARCEPRVELFEHSTDVPVLGEQGYQVKRCHIGIVLCPTPDTTRNIDEKFLQMVTRFELSADIQRTDGIFEKTFFDPLLPEEINIGGDWIFTVSDQSQLLRKLFAL